VIFSSNKDQSGPREVRGGRPLDAVLSAEASSNPYQPGLPAGPGHNGPHSPGHAGQPGGWPSNPYAAPPQLPYPYPPGGRAPHKPRRRAWIGGVVAVLLLLLAGMAVGLYLNDRAGEASPSAGEPSPSQASEEKHARPEDLKPAAQAYVDAVNRGDEAVATKLTCRQADPGVLFEVVNGQTRPYRALVGEARILSDTQGSVDFGIEGGGPPVPMRFEARNGQWCVAV
jgi:hypothetical protein